MARNSNRGRGGRNNNPSGRNRYSDWGVIEMVRERPVAAAAATAGAAAAGLFLWSKRTLIGDQLSNLGNQIGELAQNMTSSNSSGEFAIDEPPELTTSGKSQSRSAAGRSGTSRRLGMSKTGGGNASLGVDSGGGGASTSASGRGRVQRAPTS